MGFYGNITNTSKTNFIFDKIYTNRKAMDSNISKDGIFIGRYVLVEYGEITEDSFIKAYGPQEDGYYHIANNNEEATRILYTNEPIPSKDNYVKKGQIIYILGIGGKYNFLECNGGANKGKPTFTENPGLDPKTDPYFYNLKQDQAEYNVSRGYDGTVWVKTSVNNEIKYVNIAELNSVVPSFEMVADAPTMSPILPHFDTASNNVYYKLHWQPAWGMRIAETTDGSDKFSDYITSWSQEVYNKETGEIFTQWYFPNELQEDGKTKGVWRALNAGEQPPTINADIYFNHAAFDSQIGETNINKTIETNKAIYKPITLTAETYKRNKYYYKTGNRYYLDGRAFNTNRAYYEKLENYIGITADGLSGNKYNLHDGTLDTEQKPDTQQIHINLPAIGNMMSEAWDIIHGEKRDNTRTDEDGGSLQGRLDSFMAFYDNQIPVKNENGTIVGSKINGAQSYDSDWEGKPIEVLYDNTTPGFERDDAWIKTEINTNGLKTGDKGGESDQADNSGISIHHTFHATTDTKATLDKNNGAQTLKDINGYDVNDGKKSKIPVLNKSGEETGKEDTIKLYTPYVDATGHVVGKNIETITLPYGFKTITAVNSNETGKWSQGEGEESSTGENVKNIVADNTKDTFNFKGGNKWIRFQTDAENKTGTNELNPGSGSNTLTIAHETHDITTTALGNDYNTVYTEVSLSDIEYESGKYYYEKSDGKYELDCAKEITENRKYYNRSINNNIIVQDLQFDIAGHVTHNQPHTYTLPYGYKTVVTGGLNENEQKDLYTSIVLGENGAADTSTATATHSYSEADNTQDTMNIEPYNKWIQTKLSDDKLEIAHEIHAIDTVSAGTSNQNEETDANNENNINIPDWTYDKAGHITAKKDHFYTLPFGYKQVVAANDTAEDVELSTVDNSLIANNTQDVLNIKAANNWIKLNTVDTADIPNEISFSHKLVSVDESDTYIGGTYHSYTYTDLENNTTHDQKPQFGETANILNVTVDNAGHVIGFGTNTITIPIGSYTPANSTSDSTEIITSIGFTSESGAITSTKASTGTLQLDDSYSNVYILVGKIEQTEFSTLKHYIYKDNEYKAATGWSAEQDYYITKDNYVAPGDSINDAFYKLQTQIKDIYGSNKIAESFDTIKEIADFLEQDDNNKQSGVEKIISDINANTNAISAEETRATSVENNLATNIATEETRAKSVEQTLTTSLNNEIDRAKDAENTLTTNLNSEIDRAKGAESTLTTNLSGEITRATDAESALDTRITSLVGTTSVSTQITEFSSTLGTAAYTDASDYLLPTTEFVYTEAITDVETGDVTTPAVIVTIEELVKKVAALEKALKENGIILPEIE